jgi:hypothetical protein
MKKIFSFFLFILLHNYSFGQDTIMSEKIHSLSTLLGNDKIDSSDTVSVKRKKTNINYREAGHLSNLLKAAEYYNTRDYENSGFYIQKVRYKFRMNEFNNLMYTVMIGTFANEKDIKKTAKYFYVLRKSKFVDPECMQVINEAIRTNFTKENFDIALSPYYYYHNRQKIIDKIKFK